MMWNRNYKNIVVLKDYMDVIKAALEDNGYVTQYVESLKGVDKRSIIVFPMGTDAFKFYLKGYKRIILWQQGVTAEESFLRNHSRHKYAYWAAYHSLLPDIRPLIHCRQDY